VEGTAEDPVGGGAEREGGQSRWEIRDLLADDVWSGGAGFPFFYGRGKAGAACGRGPLWKRATRERRVRVRAPGATGTGGRAEGGLGGGGGRGRGLPLFLPTPSFMALADEE